MLRGVDCKAVPPALNYISSHPEEMVIPNKKHSFVPD